MTRNFLYGAVALWLLSGLLQGCGVGYVLSMGYYQAELLSKREPVNEVRQHGQLNATQLSALQAIEEARGFAKRLGLKVEQHYQTVSLGWERELWNVSACAPLDFNPKQWWFPVVGRVPYLGFFSEEAAEEQRRTLAARGWDVHKGPVGAYSTLGWFDDPILPAMLEWSPLSLRTLVFHELTHATVWLPGSVSFNESFAEFVGEQATLYFLATTLGEQSSEYREAVVIFEDGRRWRALLWTLYGELDALFKSPDLDDGEKRRRKAALFASLSERVAAAGFHRPERYHARVREGEWNNARLMQFKRYNSSHQWFAKIYQQAPGDFVAFINAVEAIVRDAESPRRALELRARALP